MAKEDKEMRDIMDAVDEICPFSAYLSESTFSNVDEWIDTGSLALNAIISGSMYKGIPVGRIVQFAGPSMTGKTFFVQKIIANAQKMGKSVMVFDSENAIDAKGAIGFGIDPTRVKYIATTTVENTRNGIRKVLKKLSENPKAAGKLVIIVDSIAQMESELGESRMDKDSAAADMGNFAKSIKSFLKTCINWGKITKTTIVFTNEVYDDPTAMYPSLEKNMPGGRAVAYKPSVTVQLARKPMKDDDGKTVDNTLAAAQKSFSGVILRCLTVKNRFIKQFLEVELYLSFATGLDRYFGLLEMMKGMGVVIANGATYKDWEGNSLGYYKAWRKDKAVWKKLLPELESRIEKEWKYSSDDVIPNEEVGWDDEELDAEEVEESPLQKLKNTKKKVTAKLDKIEEDQDSVDE